jgi:hypothetical protein
MTGDVIELDWIKKILDFKERIPGSHAIATPLDLQLFHTEETRYPGNRYSRPVITRAGYFNRAG